MHDRDTDATTRVSVASGGAQANTASKQPAIRADGRYVAFDSNDNLAGGEINQGHGVFVRDRHAVTPPPRRW